MGNASAGRTDTGSTRIKGLGTSYAFERMKVWGLATRVENTLSSAQARTYEVGTTYSLTPAVDVSGAWQMQDRNRDVGSARALVAVLDYKLTRRSGVYLSAVYDKDKGYRAYPVYGGGIQAAGDDQAALRVGLRHRF